MKKPAMTMRKRMKRSAGGTHQQENERQQHRDPSSGRVQRRRAARAVGCYRCARVNIDARGRRTRQPRTWDNAGCTSSSAHMVGAPEYRVGAGCKRAFGFVGVCVRGGKRGAVKKVGDAHAQFRADSERFSPVSRRGASPTLKAGAFVLESDSRPARHARQWVWPPLSRRHNVGLWAARKWHPRGGGRKFNQWRLIMTTSAAASCCCDSDP